MEYLLRKIIGITTLVLLMLLAFQGLGHEQNVETCSSLSADREEMFRVCAMGYTEYEESANDECRIRRVKNYQNRIARANWIIQNLSHVWKCEYEFLFSDTNRPIKLTRRISTLFCIFRF